MVFIWIGVDIMLVNLVFDYYTDIVSVPDRVAKKLKDYQDNCDEWLFDESNDHQFWIKDSNGNKSAVGICSDAFVYWLNTYVLSRSEEKAYIVKKEVKKYDKKLPTIFY